jgi:hypothetical protein
MDFTGPDPTLKWKPPVCGSLLELGGNIKSSFTCTGQGIENHRVWKQLRLQQLLQEVQGMLPFSCCFTCTDGCTEANHILTRNEMAMVQMLLWSDRNSRDKNGQLVKSMPGLLGICPTKNHTVQNPTSVGTVKFRHRKSVSQAQTVTSSTRKPLDQKDNISTNHPIPSTIIPFQATASILSIIKSPNSRKAQRHVNLQQLITAP